MRPRRVLSRGESVVAAIGLPGVGVVLLVTALSSGWILHRELHKFPDHDARSAYEAAGRSIESMLASGDASGVRRTVAALGASERIAAAQVILGEGRVLAHSDAQQITLHALPQSWPNEPTPTTTTDSAIIALDAPGRGRAILSIEPRVGLTTEQAWSAVWGVIASGAAGLALFLTAYRLARRRHASMGGVRESLLSLGAGETSLGALRVVGEGPEGRAWNGLLDELGALRERRASDKLTHHAGRRSSGGLEQVCEAMWHGVLLVNDAMQITYANNAAGALIGDEQAIAGRAIADKPGLGTLHDTLTEIMCDLAHGWRSIDIERNGGGVLRVSVRRVRRTDDASVLVLLEDISQRRVADAAKHSFVANATHELRTPLTNMRMYLETALDEGERDDAVRAQALNVIGGEIRRLERIVGDMLSVAEIESGSLSLRLDDVRIDALTKETHDEFIAQAAEKGLSLRLAMAPRLPTLRADRDRIALVLHNLVGNAVKYTPAGGSVTIAVEPAGVGVSIAVRDTGIGMSEQDQARIFEQFYRANDSRIANIPGSGLGLALAREIARRHGGDIAVESAIDKGSTFTMWLPERADAPVRAAA
ncbi:MAG: ATP-binding protein [Phycisphaerales bacterium]